VFQTRYASKEVVKKMERIKKLGIIILLLSGMLVIVFAGLPNKFSSFQGTVKINGANAATGLPVRACIGDIDKDSVDTYAASGKTWYAIDVWNGTNGDNVTFRVNGLLANEVGTYDDAVGGDIPLNLTVSAVYSYNITLHKGWNLVSIPLELQYDGCVKIV
jgi:hypothetical protein